jgi:excisionase family DNA binding protein
MLQVRVLLEDVVLPDPWVSVEDVARHLGVSKDTNYRWVEAQRLAAHKVGRFWKFKLQEIDDWVRAGGKEPWICADQEQKALALAASSLVPPHFEEVAHRRMAKADKTLAAVNERLTKEIDYWSDRWMKLREDQEAGEDVRLNLENVRRTILDLEGRLEGRKKELQAMRHLSSARPCPSLFPSLACLE